ncbi:MAG: hypothetical protein ACXWJB_03430 [Limisphaerales bacterium]
MASVKEQLVDDIKKCRKAALNEREIARKIYLLDQTFVFRNDSITGFNILNSISRKFRVPLTCVKIAGSSQTGFSSFNNRDFVSGSSDLDIAIVSPILFQRYCEIVYDQTNGYKNQTGFKDKPSFDQFQERLQVGYFRPDLMPICKEKSQWFEYFSGLTNEHSAKFKNVNGGIYFSETFFEGKQLAAVKKLIDI